MTLEQSSVSEITDKSGSKITTKRTVKTLPPKGSYEKNTPWGVTLKPVPRKSILEETLKSGSEKLPLKSPKSALPKPIPKTKPIEKKVSKMLKETFFYLPSFINCLSELQKNQTCPSSNKSRNEK